MKKKLFQTLSMWILAFVCIMAVSCGNDDEAPTELSVDLQSISLTAEGGSQTLRVTSNTNWIVTGNAGWLSVSPSASNGSRSIVVSATENNTTQPRTCTLVVTSEDGKATATVNVSQSGKAEELAVDVNTINLQATKGSTGNLNISCNAAWTISGIPEWLSISSTTGKGNANIVLTTQSDNASTTTRSAVITITSGSKTVSVTVMQGNLLQADCDVSPNDIVVLADAVALDFNYGSKVKYFFTACYTKSRIERMTDNEIIEDLHDDSNRYSQSDDLLKSFSNLGWNSEFVICCIGYNANGEHGALTKTHFTTKNGSNQAMAYISNAKYSDSRWMCTITLNGFTKKYYSWFITDWNLHGMSDAIVAWKFQQRFKANSDKFPPAVQSGDWWWNRDANETVMDLMTWAIDANDQWSGCIDHFYAEIDDSESSQKKMSNRKVASHKQYFRNDIGTKRVSLFKPSHRK